jgi:hypothetical protein
MLSVTDRFFNLTDHSDLAKTVELSQAMLAIDSEATDLCAGLNEEQLSWCSSPGRWSIAQNLAHLRRTTEVFLPVVDSALDATRNLKLDGAGQCRLKFYGRLLVWRTEGRPIIRMQAPKQLRPRLLSSPDLELEHFLIAQTAMRQRIEDAHGLNLTAMRFPSPVARYFRVNLLEFFSVFNAHSRRHLRQVKNVRRILPSSSCQAPNRMH